MASINWICPKCQMRVRAVNQARHLRSTTCTYRQVSNRRANSGQIVMNAHWKSICVDANVTMEMDMIATIATEKSSSHFDADAVMGYWVPNWVGSIMRTTKKKSRAKRLRLLKLLQEDQELAKAYISAVALGGAHNALALVEDRL